MIQKQTLLRAKDITVHFTTKGGLPWKSKKCIKAVDGVSFDLEKGVTVGLVGQSGSGKSTLGRALIQLIPLTAGAVAYDGRIINTLKRKAFFPYRKAIQMVFQDPYTALNPRKTVYQILEEPLILHFRSWSRVQRQTRIEQLLIQVGLKPDHQMRYPHQFSGGQRQRINIARALAVEPSILICDEVVSALDVSIQAQIVNLLQDLQAQLGLTCLFISHDLAVIKQISDSVLILHKGKIVEHGTASAIYQDPKHPYTQELLKSVYC